VLGSAQARFESGSGSLLYTGDFKLRASRTAAAAAAAPADVLVTETTFGLPVFRFPGREELEAPPPWRSRARAATTERRRSSPWPEVWSSSGSWLASQSLPC